MCTNKPTTTADETSVWCTNYYVNDVIPKGGSKSWKCRTSFTVVFYVFQTEVKKYMRDNLDLSNSPTQTNSKFTEEVECYVDVWWRPHPGSI